MGDRVARWVRPEIRALSAYHVPPASGLVKLDAMENPYTWPEPVVDEWLAVLRAVSLNRYPDPDARRLKQGLREFFGVPDGFEVLLGNGSDELIQMVSMAVAAPGRKALAVDPAFSMYRMISLFAGLEFVGVPLGSDDLGLDPGAVCEAIEHHEPAVVFLDYPNNPTGALFDERAVREIVEAAPGLVIVDEAYHAFSQATLMPWLAEHGNLLVLRTLSKMGLAGLRLGLLAGRAEWIEEFNKIRLPYNVNVLAQASAEFALGHRAMLEEQARNIRRDRERVFEALSRMEGLTVFPSRANFILFRAPPGRARQIFTDLKEQGVLIKSLHGSSDLMHDCLRVTIGTEEENRMFLEALERVL